MGEKIDEANLGVAFVRARNIIVDRGRKNVYTLRASRLRTSFRRFLLELEVLVYKSRIVLSGNDASKVIPDKSLGNVLVFKMVVAVNM